MLFVFENGRQIHGRSVCVRQQSTGVLDCILKPVSFLKGINTRLRYRAAEIDPEFRWRRGSREGNFDAGRVLPLEEEGQHAGKGGNSGDDQKGVCPSGAQSLGGVVAVVLGSFQSKQAFSQA